MKLERKKKTCNLTRAAIAASDHKCSCNDSPTIIEWSRKIKVCYNNNRIPRVFFLHLSLSKPNKNICLIFLLTNQDCWVIDSFFVEGEVLGQLFYTLRETNKTKTHWRLVKFIYSEKATKFWKIFTLLLSYVVPVKSKVKILQNFVAFSEYI